MNLNPTMNTNFCARPQLQKITKFRVQGKEGTTVVTEIIETGTKEKLTNLKYQIMKKGKVLEEKSYQNKKGFGHERLGSICEHIQTRVKEGLDFLDELFKAQIKKRN